jgi:uridine phosphorylase
MCNHHRGLWGYTGTTAAGHELTIQSTGIGGPSTAIVLAELARHGVRRAIRIGTCTAVEGGAPLGSVITPIGAVAADGTSRVLGVDGTSSAEGIAGSDPGIVGPGPGVVGPDPKLHELLVASVAGEATQAMVASVDVISFAPPVDGVPAIDMGTAALFALGKRLGVAVAGALVVAHARRSDRTLDDEALERASLRLGALATRALGG